jgi:hypothetical protein
MRYMMLIYSREGDRTAEADKALAQQHHAVMDEARRLGIFQGAEPLQPTGTAVTVRRSRKGEALITDGPSLRQRNSWPGITFSIAKTLLKHSSGRARFPPVVWGRKAVLKFGRLDQ